MDWLFQCNPKRFDLAAKLKEGLTAGDWSMNQHRDLVSPGDRVFFWQSGSQARLLAVGRVTSPVYDRGTNEFGSICVDYVLEQMIVPPLTRDEALEKPMLRKFRPSTGAQGTNFVIDDAAIVDEAIAEASDKSKIPITLIDGRRLADLLITHQIGVREDNVKVYRLALDDLTLENLESVVEEAGTA